MTVKRRRIRPGRPLASHRRLSALELASSLVLAAVVLLAAGRPAASASPEPGASGSPEPSASSGILDTGDPRSNGQGPGLVGSPFAVALGVVVLGLLAAGGTVLYVRLMHRD
jgi:hypothetical protein